MNKPSETKIPTGPFDLGVSPIHLQDGANGSNAVVPIVDFGFDGPSFEAYIGRHCASGPGRLVMVESTPQSWTTWERHKQGDEIVIVLAGRGNFIQDIDGNELSIPVQIGSTIINPKGVWHTADVQEPLKAIYITPCPGTEHKAR